MPGCSGTSTGWSGGKGHVARLVPFRTLRGRLTLLASLTTLPAFLFVVYIAANERTEALRRAEKDSRYVAELASREHAHQLSGTRRLLERLSSSEDIARGSLGNLPQLLPSVLRGFPQVANLWIANTAGEVAYSVVPPPGHISLRENRVFNAALASRDVAVGEYQLGPIVGRPVLLMAQAMRSADGTAHHLLIAALELSWLDAIARQAGIPPDSVLAITDASGRILAGADGHVDGFRALRARPGEMRKARVGRVPRLAVAVPLEGVRDLWVVVGPPEHKVYALANRIFYRDLIVLALFALSAVSATLIMTDLSVLRDLRLLAAATRRFGEGDLSVRAPVPRPRGEIRELTVAFNGMADALEERHREAELAQERLRALTERLSAVREEEAARIAQELHDQLGQELTVLKLEIESLRRGADARLEGWIDRMDERVTAALDTTRRISSQLRPGVLDRLGLVAALEWLLREFEHGSEITTDLVTSGIDEPLDADVATALFRIAQEALTNIARHARASLVELRLRGDDETLSLQIRDDGAGFDPARPSRATSLGILGIEERARRLGGSAKITSAPGKGTTIDVAVPRTR